MLVLADYFRAQGWRVDLEFTNGRETDLFKLVKRTNYQCIGFTISNHRCLEALTDNLSTLRNTSEWGMRPVLIGGSLLATEPAIAGRVGANGTAANEVEAFQLASTLVAAHSKQFDSELR